MCKKVRVTAGEVGRSSWALAFVRLRVERMRPLESTRALT
jgi:hypothetical protein